MTDHEMLNHLARVQDVLIDIAAPDAALGMREARARINAIYPKIAAVVDHLIAQGACQNRFSVVYEKDGQPLMRSEFACERDAYECLQEWEDLEEAGATIRLHELTHHTTNEIASSRL